MQIRNLPNRMIVAACEKGVENPWEQYPTARQSWIDWWDGKAQAKGQTPSPMFLWYLVFTHREKLNNSNLNARHDETSCNDV